MAVSEADKPKILVVEDEFYVRETVAEYLRDSDFHVEEAEDGSKAILLMKKMKVDAVVTDLMMNGMDGIDVIRFVQRQQLHIPIIVLSSSSSMKQYESELSQHNVDEIFTKPAKLSELESKLRELLEKYKKDK